MDLIRKIKSKDKLLLSIKEACQRWPESKSRSFRIKDNKFGDRFTYFLLDEPRSINYIDQNLRCKINCLIFDKKTGKLEKVSISICLTTKIIPVKMGDFKTMLMDKLEELHTQKIIKGDKKIIELIKLYEYYGFKKDS